MVVPDYNFRIRADRAVYVVGDFNEELLKQVIPRITELRFETTDPISVVISSHGGDVSCLESILSALSVRDPDGREIRVVSSVNGHADSCGAILLTMADYAIATSCSKIHFHGIRLSEYDLTTESASQIANHLSKENKSIADNMARAMMPRIMHRFSRLKKDIDAIRRKRRKYPSIMGFTDIIQERITPPTRKVFLKAVNRLIRVRQISSTLSEIKFRRRETALQKDAKLLEHIINYEVKDKSKRGLRFDEGGIGQVVFDYLTIRDFHFGEHLYFLDDLVNLWGPEFLSEQSLKKYNQLESESKPKAFKFLAAEVAFDVQDFWYLTLSLARSLLYGENNVPAWDAYWIGAIDEISGDSDCFGLRAMMEKDAPKGSTSLEPKTTAS